MRFSQGESVILPCKHCTSITISVTVQEGVFTVECSKCRGATRVKVSRSSNDWDITAEATGPSSPYRSRK